MGKKRNSKDYSKKSNKEKLLDYIKANRKGSREATLDNGFTRVTKVHLNKKRYTRKIKHKNI